MSVTRVLRTTFVVPALAALLVAAPLTAMAAPALGGSGFMASFGNRSTKDLYNFIAKSMPACGL